MFFGMEYLESLPLSDLRALGRACGVKAPTALKRKDIITNIIKIMNGEIEPYFNITKRGRPTYKKELPAQSQLPISVEKLIKIENVLNDCTKQIIKILLER